MFLINTQSKNYVSNTTLGLRYAILNKTVWASKNLLRKEREENFSNVYNDRDKAKSWEPRKISDFFKKKVLSIK